VHFPFGDETDKGRFESGGFKIDKMVERTFRSDDEFFKVVGMRLVGHGFQPADFVLVDGKNPEQGCHRSEAVEKKGNLQRVAGIGQTQGEGKGLIRNPDNDPFLW
jgi:hypothetical protein